MSKLIERLEKVGTVTPIPMGFGANRAVEKSPEMLLVVLSGTNAPESTSQIEAHSYITSAGKITKAALKAAEQRVKQLPKKQQSAARKKAKALIKKQFDAKKKLIPKSTKGMGLPELGTAIKRLKVMKV